MKPLKLSLDLSDVPKVVETMRLYAAKKGVSQKSIVVEALTRYFNQEQESLFIKSAADRMFADWNNAEDDVYDSL